MPTTQRTSWSSPNIDLRYGKSPSNPTMVRSTLLRQPKKWHRPSSPSEAARLCGAQPRPQSQSVESPPVSNSSSKIPASIPYRTRTPSSKRSSSTTWDRSWSLPKSSTITTSPT
uniref:(northern house mosquito) hypothetical protein n=1 Tax=Culex pipiens TaxID=7175 RepID=A0A8D8JN55_CULPI